MRIKAGGGVGKQTSRNLSTMDTYATRPVKNMSSFKPARKFNNFLI